MSSEGFLTNFQGRKQLAFLVFRENLWNSVIVVYCPGFLDEGDLCMCVFRGSSNDHGKMGELPELNFAFRDHAIYA